MEIRPKYIVPTTLPILDIEPTQLASSIVNLPDSKGESSDCKIGSVGLNQPMAQPCPSTTILAAKIFDEKINTIIIIKIILNECTHIELKPNDRRR